VGWLLGNGSGFPASYLERAPIERDTRREIGSPLLWTGDRVEMNAPVRSRLARRLFRSGLVRRIWRRLDHLPDMDSRRIRGSVAFERGTIYSANFLNCHRDLQGFQLSTGPTLCLTLVLSAV